MPLLANIIGFGAFGFGARVFQLGLQKRPLFDAPVGHLISSAAFGTLGYYLYFAEQRQNELIAEKKKVLAAHRAAEAAAAA